MNEWVWSVGEMRRTENRRTRRKTLSQWQSTYTAWKDWFLQPMRGVYWAVQTGSLTIILKGYLSHMQSEWQTTCCMRFRVSGRSVILVFTVPFKFYSPTEHWTYVMALQISDSKDVPCCQCHLTCLTSILFWVVKLCSSGLYTDALK